MKEDLKKFLIMFGVTIWVTGTVVLGLFAYHTNALNQELKVQVQLFKELRFSEHELWLNERQKCTDVMEINRVCEKVVKDFTVQLGLDFVSPNQLLTTAIVAREEARGQGGE